MQRNEPLRLSASATKAFLECPYRYAKDYVDRLPASEREPVASFSFGNALHQALADFVRQGAWKVLSLDDLIGLLMRHWEGGVYPDADTELYHFHRGKEMLARFYSQAYPTGVEKELGVEQYVTWQAPRKGLLATGKLDRACLLHGSILEIVDYKTGTWIPKEDDLKKDLQALFYRTLGAEHYRGLRPQRVRVSFYYLPAGEVVSVEFEQEDFMERWQEVESVGRMIRDALVQVREGQSMALAFPLNRSKNCSRCPMRGHCDRLEDKPQKEDT